MFNSTALEVGIGLALTFLLFSLLLSSLQEGIEALLKGRAKALERAIWQLLDDTGGDITKRLYEHPLIYSLFPGKYGSAHSLATITTRLPSYIPSGHFAVALADIVSGKFVGRAKSDDNNEPVAFDELVSPQVKRVFQLANTSSASNVEGTLKGIEQWYDAAMARLSGRYKRNTQIQLFFLALLVAWLCNVDALNIGNMLLKNQQMRERLVVEASALGSGSETALAALARLQPPDATQVEIVKSALTKIESGKAELIAAGLPVGRAEHESLRPQRMAQFVGWLITALAAMLGAPFWFDLLGKFMNVRAALKPSSDSIALAAAAPPKKNAFAGGIKDSALQWIMDEEK